MASILKRNDKILQREKSALIVIDIQEKILGVMHNRTRLSRMP